MVYLTTALVTIVAAELFCRFPLKGLVAQLADTLKKVIWVVPSKSISDHWKERVLLIYSGRIALATLKITAAVGFIALVVVALSAILDRIFSLPEPTVDVLMSWLGMSLATLAAVAYFSVRRRIAP